MLQPTHHACNIMIQRLHMCIGAQKLQTLAIWLPQELDPWSENCAVTAVLSVLPTHSAATQHATLLQPVLTLRNKKPKDTLLTIWRPGVTVCTTWCSTTNYTLWHKQFIYVPWTIHENLICIVSLYCINSLAFLADAQCSLWGTNLVFKNNQQPHTANALVCSWGSPCEICNEQRH